MLRRFFRLTGILTALMLAALPLAQIIGAQGLPQVNVAATDSVATEVGADSGAFMITRGGDTSAALTVTYSVAGTATAGTDYTALSGSAIIAAGASAATILVTPIDDLVDEPSETVILTLLTSTAYSVGSMSTATVVIRDNDGIDRDDHRDREGDRDDDDHEGMRPGWGWGDRNHEHFGPPGLACTASASCIDDDDHQVGASNALHGISKDDDDEDSASQRHGRGHEMAKGHGRGHD